MHAADVMEPLPAVRLDDAVLTALRIVLRHDLPGLVVTDARGAVVAGLSSVELLRVVLPRYLRDDPGLARVYGENHADRIAARLAGTAVREVIGEVAGRIPVARQEATLVELAEVMSRQCCPMVLIERAGHHGGMLGVVTANGLLKVLDEAAGGSSQ